MRTASTLSALVAELSANCGDMFEACRSVGVSTIFVSQWRKDDKQVDADLSEAERVGSMRLESEAIRRAVHGVEKGVYYKGEKVDTEVVYSDGLLQTVLKARLPAYKTGEGGGTTFTGPTQINIMPRATNYDEWLAMKDATTNRKALPAPEAVEDAEFTAVPASPQFEGLGL